jgi:predicted dehydrogenase
MEAFLKLLADGKLDLHSLITHRFPIAQAHSAYDLIMGKTQEPFLGMLIVYSDPADDTRQVNIAVSARPSASNQSVSIGLLGAGSFATSTLLPAMKRVGAEMVVACAANGSHARHAAEKFGFRSCTTDEQEILNNPAVNTVVIVTRHHLHATQVKAALRSGKHVFCEKPLCLNEVELNSIVAAREDQASSRQLLMVGFNRRFAPLAIRLKSFLKDVREPLALHYRVNAGFLPADHWLNDPLQGGGRILGEVCHFVDFLCFLTNASPMEVETRSLPNPGHYSNDNIVCSLRFANGSQGTISYLANGDKSYSKERIEVFGGGSIAVLEDFRRLELVRGGNRRVYRSLLRQDKGHRGEWEAFITAIQTGAVSPIPFREVVSATLATFALEESRCLAKPVAVSRAVSLELADLRRDDHADASGLDRAS